MHHFSRALLYFLMLGSSLFAQRPGTIRWHTPIQSASVTGELKNSPAIGPDGTIYVANSYEGGTAASQLYAIHPDGMTNWIFSADGNLSGSPAIGPNGDIYITGRNGALYSVGFGGAANWVVRTGGSFCSSPAVAADGTVYFAAVSNYFNKLFAVGPDGSTNWVFDMIPIYYPQQISAQFASAAIGPDGTIFIGSVDTNLYAINPNGTLKWTFRLGDATYGSPAVGTDGTVYIGSDDHSLHAVGRDGHQLWQFLTGSYIESSPAISAGGTIYISSLDGKTYALSAEGTQLWHSFGYSLSPALGANDTLYVSAAAGVEVLYGLTNTGATEWAAPIYNGSNMSLFSSPAVGSDGTIYIASTPYLYAIYGNGPPAPGSWAMFRRGPTHNARALQRSVSQPAPLPDGNVALTFGTETGVTYTVQASLDLVSWSNLDTFVPTNFTTQFLDTGATNFPARFYRLASP